MPLGPGDAPFVGRERERRQLGELLSRGRVLTLVGPGGIGKSRLACEFGRGIATHFSDGLCVIDLHAGTAHSDWGRALARATRHANAGQDRLFQCLPGHELLLVLDNCEADVDSSAELISYILRRSERVQVLATSREPLRIDGELVWTVPPLASPDPEWVDPNRIGSSDAVRLFLTRVQERVPEFSLSGSNANRVVILCHRLRGSPLLIEAAAAQVAIKGLARVCADLTPKQLLDLEDRTRPLVRHRSLRASLDWDYALLDDADRVLLARLGMFPHGWSLQAAEHVCSDAAMPVHQIGLRLSRLVARSLVEIEHAAEPRTYQMSDLVRQYVQDLPRGGLGHTSFERRRAARLIVVGSRVPPARLDRTVAHALYREREDLNLALDWAIGAREADLAFNLAVVGYPMWYRHGLLAEGRHWLRRVFGAGVAGSQRATVACLAGHLAVLGAEIAEARDLARDALAACTPNADAGSVARTRYLELQVALSSGEKARARALIDAGELAARAVAKDHQLGAMVDVAVAIVSARLSLELDDLRRAATLATAAGAAAREREDRFWFGRALNVQALVAMHMQENVGARWLIERAIGIQLADDDVEGQVDSCCALGQIELSVGSLHAAGRAFRRAFDLAAPTGLRLGQLRAIDGIVCSSAASRPRTALQLAVAGVSLRRSTGAFVWPRERRQLLACLQTGLDRPMVARTLETQAATAISWDTVVDLVHDLVEPEATDNVEGPDVLTPREREVAALLMRGLSNQQIALSLTISVGTVRAHIEHILAKLGLHSRAQVTSWAVRARQSFA